jgi:hypothetical protein
MPTDSANATENSGNAGLWSVLAVGAALGCLLLIGTVGIVAALFWPRPANEPNREVANFKPAGPEPGGKNPQIENPGPPKNPIEKPPPATIGKAPWGTDNVNDLDAEIAIWDFSIRLPKNYDTLMNNVKIQAQSEVYHYKWRLKGGMDHIDVSKARSQGIDPLTLYKNDPVKSGPKELIQFEVFRGPQEVHINNLRAARQWRWHTSLPPGGAITVSYRFEIDGWHYAFNANAVGKSRAEAEKTASLLDVSLCTFRKR